MLQRYILPILMILVMQTNACSEEGSEKSAEKRVGNISFAEQKNYLAMIPQETSVVFFANLAEMRNTPLGQELAVEISSRINEEKDRDYVRFVEKTGLNPEKDIYQLWMGGLAHDENGDVAGIIATGNFDEGRIVSYLREQEKHKHEEVEYKGHKIYVSREEKDNSEFSFLNTNTVVAGNHDWVKSVLDRAEGASGSVLDNPAMALQIDDVSGQNQLWGVMDLAEASNQWAKDLKRSSSFRGTESIKNIKTLSFYAQLDQKADVHVKGNFTTAEEAELLAETINGFKAMAKLMMTDDREAIDMLNDISVSTQENILEITAKVDRRFFEKVKEKQRTLSNSPVKML